MRSYLNRSKVFIRRFSTEFIVIEEDDLQLLDRTVSLASYCLHPSKIVYTEEKAKVVAASWGKKLFAALAIFHQDEVKNRMICTLFINLSWCKSAYSSNHTGAK